MELLSKPRNCIRQVEVRGLEIKLVHRNSYQINFGSWKCTINCGRIVVQCVVINVCEARYSRKRAMYQHPVFLSLYMQILFSASLLSFIDTPISLPYSKYLAVLSSVCQYFTHSLDDFFIWYK